MLHRILTAVLLVGAISGTCGVVPGPVENEVAAQGRIHVCTTPNPPPDAGLSLAMDVNRQWPNGSTLRVRFLNGDAALQARVQRFAVEWSEFANITFDFGDHSDSQIRIEFASDGKSESQVGTDALKVDQSHATMHFGFGWDARTADEAVRATVLHEFGHALGFIHEHQSPANGIPWDRAAAYEYFMSVNPSWSKEYVDKNVFDTSSKSSTNFSRFDPESIMLYAIPDELTIGNYATRANTTLSAQDRRMARLLYPRDNETLSVNCTITNRTDRAVTFTLHGGGERVTLRAGERRSFSPSRRGAQPFALVLQPDRRINGALGISVTVPGGPPRFHLLTDSDYEVRSTHGHYYLELPAESARDRAVWQYATGAYKDEGGGRWVETNTNSTWHFRETTRTDEYVELYDDSRAYTVRLYAESCWIKGGNERVVNRFAEWTPLGNGLWVRNGDTRMFWVYDGGTVAATGGGNWTQRHGDTDVWHFKEVARTPEYVELYDDFRGYSARLHKDFFWIKGGNERVMTQFPDWTRLGAGAWSGTK